MLVPWAMAMDPIGQWSWLWGALTFQSFGAYLSFLAAAALSLHFAGPRATVSKFISGSRYFLVLVSFSFFSPHVSQLRPFLQVTRTLSSISNAKYTHIDDSKWGFHVWQSDRETLFSCDVLCEGGSGRAATTQRTALLGGVPGQLLHWVNHAFFTCSNICSRCHLLFNVYVKRTEQLWQPMIQIFDCVIFETLGLSRNANPALHRHHNCGALRRPFEESAGQMFNCLLGLCSQFVTGHLFFVLGGKTPRFFNAPVWIQVFSCVLTFLRTCQHLRKPYPHLRLYA